MDKDKRNKIIKNIITWIVSAIIGAGVALGIITTTDDGKAQIDQEEVSEKLTDKVIDKLDN